MRAKKPIRASTEGFTLAVVLASALSALSMVQAQSGCPGESALFHPCALARATTFRPTRTVDGQPDLQGFWRGPASGTENVEEHPMTDDDNGGKSLIVEPRDGKVPYQPWAAALQKEKGAGMSSRTCPALLRASLARYTYRLRSKSFRRPITC